MENFLTLIIFFYQKEIFINSIIWISNVGWYAWTYDDSNYSKGLCIIHVDRYFGFHPGTAVSFSTLQSERIQFRYDSVRVISDPSHFEECRGSYSVSIFSPKFFRPSVFWRMQRVFFSSKFFRPSEMGQKWGQKMPFCFIKNE